MDKSKILTIGCGGCGCNQLDILMDLDRRYTGLFANTNLNEMQGLKNFNIDRRCFYIANADGTGKNRDLAEEYMKEESAKFIETITRFANQTYVLLLTSANGGTGSKISLMMAKLIKRACPSKIVSLVVTFPSMEESDIDYQNAIEFWNELINFKNKGYIDSFQFIDNDKSTNEEEVNIKAMKELDESLSFASGKLDNSDLERVHSTSGYKMFLKLDTKTTDFKTALNDFQRNTMFYIPENNHLECDSIVGDLSNLSQETINDQIDVYGFSKYNKNDESNFNLLLLGGCDTPKDVIMLMKEALRESKKKKRSRISEEDIIVKIDKEDKSEKSVTQQGRLSSKDIDAIYNDDDFWND